MPPITERGGVKFDEGMPEKFVELEKLSTQLNSGFGQDQLKSLRDVKEAMAVQALSLGGNYIANFTYGQKTGGVLQQLWSVDNMLWYGDGTVGKLDD
jgi:hypothetical protein